MPDDKAYEFEYFRIRKDMVELMIRHFDDETDNYGQVIIYTDFMRDSAGNLVPWDGQDHGEDDREIDEHGPPDSLHFGVD